ncbi:MAG: hypothetical protein P8018_13970 [Acidobacteriota bacterium]
MATALLSAFTNIPIRHMISMTGEVTLRGKVLAVGGLKEKILASRQHEIFQVLLPRENEKDLTEVPEALREGMTFHLVDSLEEVFALALAEDPFRRRPTPPLGSVEAPRPAKNP